MPAKSPLLFTITAAHNGCGLCTTSAALAAQLAQHLRCVLVSLDPNAPSLARHFGVNVPTPNLSDWLLQPALDLNQVLISTQISPNLKLLLPQDSLSARLHFTSNAKETLWMHLANLDADVVLAVLSPGVRASELYFLATADMSFMVVSPQAAAIQRANSMLRQVLQYLVCEHFLPAEQQHRVLSAPMPEGLKELAAEVQPHLPAKITAESWLKRLHPWILLNQVPPEHPLKTQMAISLFSRFKGENSVLAALPKVDFQEAAFRDGKPLNLHNLQSAYTQEMHNLGDLLLEFIQPLQLNSLRNELAQLRHDLEHFYQTGSLASVSTPTTETHLKEEVAERVQDTPDTVVEEDDLAWMMATDPFDSALQTNAPGGEQAAKKLDAASGQTSELKAQGKQDATIHTAPQTSEPNQSESETDTSPIQPDPLHEAAPKPPFPQPTPKKLKELHLEPVDMSGFKPPDGFQAIDPIGILPEIEW